MAHVKVIKAFAAKRTPNATTQMARDFDKFVNDVDKLGEHYESHLLVQGIARRRVCELGTRKWPIAVAGLHWTLLGAKRPSKMAVCETSPQQESLTDIIPTRHPSSSTAPSGVRNGSSSRETRSDRV